MLSSGEKLPFPVKLLKASLSHQGGNKLQAVKVQAGKLGQAFCLAHSDLRVRWKVASDLRFRVAISEAETPSSCGISGDLAPSTQKSLGIAIVRFLVR